MSRRAFRRRSALDVWSMNFGPSMTPMVDVVLVILIFFMASASFVGPEWFLRAALPVFDGEPDDGAFFDLPPAEFEVRVTLGDDGLARVTGFGGRDVTLGSFRSLVFSEMGGLSADSVIVLIDPDPNVRYNDVVQVHEACVAAGVERVGIR